MLTSYISCPGFCLSFSYCIVIHFELYFYDVGKGFKLILLQMDRSCLSTTYSNSSPIILSWDPCHKPVDHKLTALFLASQVWLSMCVSVLMPAPHMWSTCELRYWGVCDDQHGSPFQDTLAMRCSKLSWNTGPQITTQTLSSYECPALSHACPTRS